jgi:hypothetical protein
MPTSLAWPPGAHDAIGDGASEGLPEIQLPGDTPTDIRFRCGNILADIPHLLELPPFSVSDADEVMHTRAFSKKMFEIAKQANDEDQMAWSAGWYSHHTADHVWASQYIKDCNIPQGTLQEYLFDFTNEVAIKYKHNHELVTSWISYPDLIAETYREKTGKTLPSWKINLATKVWIKTVENWYRSLPDYLRHSLQNRGGIWETTRDNWRTYFDIGVDEVIKDVKELYTSGSDSKPPQGNRLNTIAKNSERKTQRFSSCNDQAYHRPKEDIPLVIRKWNTWLPNFYTYSQSPGNRDMIKRPFPEFLNHHATTNGEEIPLLSTLPPPLFPCLPLEVNQGGRKIWKPLPGGKFFWS